MRHGSKRPRADHLTSYAKARKALRHAACARHPGHAASLGEARNEHSNPHTARTHPTPARAGRCDTQGRCAARLPARKAGEKPGRAPFPPPGHQGSPRRFLPRTPTSLPTPLGLTQGKPPKQQAGTQRGEERAAADHRNPAARERGRHEENRPGRPGPLPRILGNDRQQPGKGPGSCHRSPASAIACRPSASGAA